MSAWISRRVCMHELYSYTVVFQLKRCPYFVPLTYTYVLPPSVYQVLRMYTFLFTCAPRHPPSPCPYRTAAAPLLNHQHRPIRTT